ncbi:MAG: hypothetical protein OEX02_15635 [Cyclobacteriaceae bacterium]|nr:hypothetical protein [Cyclobacteriaceae bacterium]
MIDEFEGLEQEEIDILLKAPVLVCILIAGADDNIDKSEFREAVNLAQIKQRKARRSLLNYYAEVGKDFEDKMKILINNLPVKAQERNIEIVKELEQLNKVFPKVGKKFGRDLYSSLRDMAKKIAEASGGILGYMSVGYEESKYIELKMIKDPHKQ